MFNKHCSPIVMDSQSSTLSILFFPYMAQGHMLPMLDMAKLFALRGAKTTILTTHANAPLVQPSIDRAAADGSIVHPIRLRLVPFPSGTGLPDGCENVSSLPTKELHSTFLAAMRKLREPFGRVLEELRPDCVVTDMFLPWTYHAAAELGIPRLVFHGVSFFTLCISSCMKLYKPLEGPPAEAETLVVPGFPYRLEMLRSQLSKFDKTMPDSFVEILESESKSYGVVANSFYELEPDYVRHYRSVFGRRAWHIGPLALCNRDDAHKSVRGCNDDIDRRNLLQWLGNKRSGSVIYICFGSAGDCSVAQLREMALGLEAAGHPFIWVVRTDGNEWIPEGFEERVEGRGLIVRGWAPQMLILNHPSVGGFVTHCGWNSTLEGVSAGLPLVTWPMFAEQFYNERLIVDVLKIGVSVGAKENAENPEERGLVEAATIKTAVDEVMGGGEDAEDRRKRARELAEAARRAVEIGGSSYEDMSKLIQELTDMKNSIQAQEPHT